MAIGIVGDVPLDIAFRPVVPRDHLPFVAESLGRAEFERGVVVTCVPVGEVLTDGRRYGSFKNGERLIVRSSLHTVRTEISRSNRSIVRELFRLIDGVPPFVAKLADAAGMNAEIVQQLMVNAVSELIRILISQIRIDRDWRGLPGYGQWLAQGCDVSRGDL